MHFTILSKPNWNGNQFYNIYFPAWFFPLCSLTCSHLKWFWTMIGFNSVWRGILQTLCLGFIIDFACGIECFIMAGYNFTFSKFEEFSSYAIQLCFAKPPCLGIMVHLIPIIKWIYLISHLYVLKFCLHQKAEFCNTFLYLK